MVFDICQLQVRFVCSCLLGLYTKQPGFNKNGISNGVRRRGKKINEIQMNEHINLFKIITRTCQINKNRWRDGC